MKITYEIENFALALNWQSARLSVDCFDEFTHKIFSNSLEKTLGDVAC